MNPHPRPGRPVLRTPGTGALALLLGCCLCLTTSCGGPSADPHLSDATARAQMYTYLRKTVSALPAGASLSLTSDSARQGFAEGEAGVCSDSDGTTPPDTPVSISLYYWVNGTPHGQEAAYFNRIVHLWQSWGWTKTPDSTPTRGTFNGPDGYFLMVTNAANGPGSVSMAAESPCFRDKNADMNDPHLAAKQPHTIHQTH